MYSVYGCKIKTNGVCKKCACWRTEQFLASPLQISCSSRGIRSLTCATGGQCSLQCNKSIVFRLIFNVRSINKNVDLHFTLSKSIDVTLDVKFVKCRCLCKKTACDPAMFLCVVCWFYNFNYYFLMFILKFVLI